VNEVNEIGRHHHGHKKYTFWQTLKYYTKKYGFYSLFIFIILIYLSSFLPKEIMPWTDSIAFFLFLVNVILLIAVYFIKAFRWLNGLDLSDDLKYFFTKILSIVLFVGLIIFLLVFGGFGNILSHNNLIDAINVWLYYVSFYGLVIWLFLLVSFLGLRQKRRYHGIWIWTK